MESSARPVARDRDDHPGLAEAVAAALHAGGGALALVPDRTYRLSKTLEVDPTRITLLGRGATLSFSARSFHDPEAGPERAPISRDPFSGDRFD